MGPCPVCEQTLVWRHNGAWCDRCHRKVETCCEGAPQPLGTGMRRAAQAGGVTVEIPLGN